MRGQFAGVARNCWSSWGDEFGTRDRVVSVRAVAARMHTIKQLQNLLIVQFYGCWCSTAIRFRYVRQQARLVWRWQLYAPPSGAWLSEQSLSFVAK